MRKGTKEKAEQKRNPFGEIRRRRKMILLEMCKIKE